MMINENKVKNEVEKMVDDLNEVNPIVSQVVTYILLFLYERNIEVIEVNLERDHKVTIACNILEYPQFLTIGYSNKETYVSNSRLSNLGYVINDEEDILACMEILFDRFREPAKLPLNSERLFEKYKKEREQLIQKYLLEAINTNDVEIVKTLMQDYEFRFEKETIKYWKKNRR